MFVKLILKLICMHANFGFVILYIVLFNLIGLFAELQGKPLIFVLKLDEAR